MQTGESLYALALAGLEARPPGHAPGDRRAAGPAAGVRRLVRRQSLRAVSHAISGDAVGFDRALIALSQSEAASARAGTARSGRSPRRFAPIRPASSSATWSEIWDVPGRRSRAADRSHSLATSRRWCARPLAGRWDASATKRRSPAWPDAWATRAKVVRRAAAEALRLMGNRLNGSHRPGETHGPGSTGRRAVRGPPLGRRSDTPRCHAGLRRPLPRTVAGDGAGRRRCSSVCGDPDPVVAMQAIKGLWRWWYWRADPA